MNANPYAGTDEDGLVAVGFDVCLEVKIDKQTGRVVRVVVFPTDFNALLPIHVYDDENDFLGVLDDETHVLQPSAQTDERVQWACAIADTVNVNGDVEVPFTIVAAAPEATNG